MFQEPAVSSFILDGGLDFVTPHIDLAPGRLIGCKNVEQEAGIRGYWRVGGAERTDGHRLQSDANYTVFTISNLVTGGSVGDIFTGATSGAEAVLLSEPTATEVYVYILEGADPIASETFNGAVSGSFTFVSSTTPHNIVLDEVEYTAAARTYARNLIGAVPGSGDILGVCRLDGVDYAFRNNSGGTAAEMYKSTLSGWTKIEFGYVVKFIDGTGEFVTGETITTGSVTSIVKAVVKSGGSWTDPADKAYGHLVLHDVGTTIASGSTINGSLTGVAVADGDSYELVLNPSGKYEFRVYNFYGSIDTRKMYWTDGKNTAFEYDGSWPVPIMVNGLDSSDDIPSHLGIFQSRLFLGYAAGSVQYSTVEDPKVFEEATGAGYYDPGEAITGFKNLAGNTMVFFCTNSIWFLQGAAKASWVFSRFTSDFGALAFSMQGSGDVFFIDDVNLISLTTTASFGDFKSRTHSNDIQPFLTARKGKLNTTLRVLDKAQYRMFFSDGDGITLTFNDGKVVGFTQFEYPFTVTCAYNDDEYLLVGATDGYVYKLDSGNDFDGTAIEGYLRLPYYNYGTPRNFKQFIKLMIQLTYPVVLSDTTVIRHSASYGYGSDRYARGIEFDDTIDGGGGFYDSNDYWSQFRWDTQYVNEIESDIEGVGENMSLLISFSATHDERFLLYSCLVDLIKLGRRP